MDYVVPQLLIFKKYTNGFVSRSLLNYKTDVHSVVLEKWLCNCSDYVLEKSLNALKLAKQMVIQFRGLSAVISLGLIQYDRVGRKEDLWYRVFIPYNLSFWRKDKTEIEVKKSLSMIVLHFKTPRRLKVEGFTSQTTWGQTCSHNSWVARDHQMFEKKGCSLLWPQGGSLGTHGLIHLKITDCHHLW